MALFAVGDSDLSNIAGTQSYDACIVEFDSVPFNDTIQISYIFASEEYPEFVNSGYNDAFAFFISGPGISGTQNIARLPGTTTPVSINNVNMGSYACPGPSTGCTNCGFYIDNCNGTTIQYDGFTTAMIASSSVTPCQS